MIEQVVREALVRAFGEPETKQTDINGAMYSLDRREVEKRLQSEGIHAVVSDAEEHVPLPFYGYRHHPDMSDPFAIYSSLVVAVRPEGGPETSDSATAFLMAVQDDTAPLMWVSPEVYPDAGQAAFAADMCAKAMARLRREHSADMDATYANDIEETLPSP